MTRKVRIGDPEDIPLRQGRRIDVGGRDVALFHLESGFHAIDVACPHRGGPLSDGMVTGDCVTCPLHGWKVSLSDGRVLPPNPGSVRVYGTEITEEGIFLLLGDGDPEEGAGGPREGASDAAGEGANMNGERAT